MVIEPWAISGLPVEKIARMLVGASTLSKALSLDHHMLYELLYKLEHLLSWRDHVMMLLVYHGWINIG